MSGQTEYLKLFKWDTTNQNDLSQQFNIERSMNENWDKIEENAKSVNTKITETKEYIDEQIEEIPPEVVVSSTQPTGNDWKIWIDEDDEDDYYSQILNQIPKGTVEGDSITINDSSDLPVVDVVVKGKTEQMTTSIANGDEYDSPSPDYPQDIHVVTGNCEVVLDNIALPEGYHHVEYIESTGTQYIDTGIKAKGTLRTILDFENTLSASETHTYGGALFGGRNASATNTYCLWIDWTTYNYGLRSDYNTTADSCVSVDAITDRFLVDKNCGYTTITDSDKNITSKTVTNATFTSSYNMCLFAKNNAGTIDSFTRYRLYSCKIYDDDVLVRDFIPCYRKSDNIIGLYDLVSKTFYTNSGSGTFLKGAIIGKQSYPLTLGNIELCKIGNYEDYIYKSDDKWYLYKNTGKYVFTGDETVFNYAEDRSIPRVFTSINNLIEINIPSSANITAELYSDIFTAKPFSDYNNNTISNNTMMVSTGGYISIFSDIFTSKDVSELKDHYIVGRLATPTTTEITDTTLLTQLEALLNSKTYKNITHIDTTGEDLSPNIEVIYRKDLETMFNNLQAQILS